MHYGPGSDEGAESWAVLASLIETWKLNGVEPQAYLTDVLTKLVNLWPAGRLDELMPRVAKQLFKLLGCGRWTTLKASARYGAGRK